MSSLVSHCEAAGMDAYCDLNCSVKRLQWELCQLAPRECAASDAPPRGAPAPSGISHQLNLEDDEDAELDEALQEWKRRYVHQWSFRALFVPFILFRKARRRRREQWRRAVLCGCVLLCGFVVGLVALLPLRPSQSRLVNQCYSSAAAHTSICRALSCLRSDNCSLYDS